MPPRGPDTLSPEQRVQRASELREKLFEASEKLQGLRSKPMTDWTEDNVRDAKATRDMIFHLDAEHRAFEIATTNVADTRSAGDLAAAFLSPSPEFRSPGRQLTEMKEYREASDNDSRINLLKSGQYFKVDISGHRPGVELEGRATVDSTVTSGGALVPRAAPEVVRPRQQRLAIRDLLNVVRTQFPTPNYVRETNAATNEGGATVVAEGTSKPEATVALAVVDAPVRKIAVVLPVTDEALSDAPQLENYLNNRLLYMLLVRENQQILSGAGTGQDLAGILSDAGRQTQAAVGTGDKLATLAAAIGKVENVDGEASGIAMNPVDFWAMLAFRPASNPVDPAFSGNAVVGLNPPNVYGIPVVRTRALASLRAVVGDWQMGATLFSREEAYVKAYDQHADFAQKNLVLLLAEERVSLAIHRPDLFVDTTLN